MASRSLNKVQLIGNLTRDPELRYTPTGAAVCTLGLATNRSWTTEAGEKKEDVEFLRYLFYSNALFVRERAINPERFTRAISALECLDLTMQEKRAEILDELF